MFDIAKEWSSYIIVGINSGLGAKLNDHVEPNRRFIDTVLKRTEPKEEYPKTIRNVHGTFHIPLALL